LADEEVRNAIQEEMDDKAFWDKVEAVVVGTLTLAALLLTIFPPTTAVGVAALASLELSLGIYGVQKGIEMQEVGGVYRLMTGAHDVITPGQQAAGDAMVFGGFLQVALGSLSAYTGAFRAASLLPREASFAQSTGGLLRIGQTVQRGEYLLTLGADGSLTVSVVSRPDLLFIIRGETATLYQSMGPGGMRVLMTGKLPSAAPSVAGAPRLLTAGEEAAQTTSALVPVTGAAQTGRVLITPPREPLPLGTGAPTTYTWEQISRMRQPRLWQEREIHLQEVYGAPGQQHFPVPGTGGRYVDVPAPGGGGRLFAGEVKSYTRWITVEGQAQRSMVHLTDRIQEQINRDVWLRQNVHGYDPRWIFTDAPPSLELAQALRDANITFIVY
jgi:hypothetical protein